jgi:putative hydrolase of the HAD superfamily
LRQDYLLPSLVRRRPDPLVMPNRSSGILAAMNALPPAPTLSFGHVTDWVFDLDNTLYPRRCNLFAQIDSLITTYVMGVTRLDREPARVLQKQYYRDFGTTLNGLMLRHAVDPDHFLANVHAIDYSPVEPHPELIAAIRRLPGRKFVFTNGDEGHASAVLDRLGGTPVFDAIFDIRSMGYRPKPFAEAYEALLSAHDIDPARAAMFDDLEKNLLIPHESGMRTVHVIAGSDFAHAQVEAWELVRSDAGHIHHTTDDLAGFLGRLP